MKPYTLLYFSSFALVFSHSVEHSKQKRSGTNKLQKSKDTVYVNLGMQYIKCKVS